MLADALQRGLVDTPVVQGFKAVQDGGQVDPSFGAGVGGLMGSAYKNLVLPPIEAVQNLSQGMSGQGQYVDGNYLPMNPQEMSKNAAEIGMLGTVASGMMMPKNSLGMFGGKMARGADDFLPQGSPERAENFKKWFGDSKVVDEKGEPLTVYHGTDADFNVFNAGDRSMDESVANPLGENIGAFFTGNKRDTPSFGKKTIEANVNLRNPMVFEDQNAFRMFMRENSGLEPDIRDAEGYIVKEGKFKNNMRSAIESLGHDGVMIKKPDFNKSKKANKPWYIAFEPEQIKSTSNQGTYNPNDPNIMRGGLMAPIVPQEER